MTLCPCRNGNSVLLVMAQDSARTFNAVVVGGIISVTGQQPALVVMVLANVRLVLARVVTISRFTDKPDIESMFHETRNHSALANCYKDGVFSAY